MGDGGPERALALGPLDVDVDPLVVARDLGELVDVRLGHLDPVAGADRLADQLAELVDPGDRQRRHRRYGTAAVRGPTNVPRRGALSRRLLFALVAITTTFVIAGIAIGAGGSGKRDLTDTRSPSGLPDGFEPAVLRAQNALNRYFVVVDGPSVASKTAAVGRQPLRRQAGRRRGGGAPEPGGRDRRGPVARRRRRLPLRHARRRLLRQPLARRRLRPRRARRRQVRAAGLDRPEGERDQRPVHRRAPVWHNYGVRGQGMVVADVDTGIDYTHANFGGPGTVAAPTTRNDPNFIEPGSSRPRR